MANPFPFVAGNVLTAAELNGIGEATSAYTPIYGAGITVGNGVVIAQYTRVNKLVYGYWQITLGSTSAITAAVRVGFPVNIVANNQNQPLGGFVFNDISSGLTYTGFTYCDSTAQNMYGVTQNSTGNHTYLQALNSTTPVVPATGDIIRYTFLYEAA